MCNDCMMTKSLVRVPQIINSNNRSLIKYLYEVIHSTKKKLKRLQKR
jgi:hypothetical protein